MAIRQTHFLPTRFPRGSGSTAYWSLNPDGRALFFVHGFGGQSEATWQQFPSLLLRDPKCDNVDFIFYGYNGLRVRAGISATMLRECLDDVFEDSYDLVSPELEGRPENTAITQVTLVCHSLGTIVARQALLEAAEQKRFWVDKIRLVLFAPAHRGANVIELFKQAAVFPLAAVLGSFARFRYAAAQDLEQNSPFLEELFNRTKQTLDTGGSKALLARAIYFGELEGIVNPIRFLDDPPHHVYPNRGHMDVCKPNAEFQQPLTDVLQWL